MLLHGVYTLAWYFGLHYICIIKENNKAILQRRCFLKINFVMDTLMNMTAKQIVEDFFHDFESAEHMADYYKIERAIFVPFMEGLLALNATRQIPPAPQGRLYMRLG